MEKNKTNLRALLIGFIAGLLFVALVASCGGGSDEPPVRDDPPPAAPTARPTAPTRYKVEYRITGRGSVDEADVTFQNAQGGTEQSEVDVPYSKHMRLHDGDFVYIAAQKLQRGGEITCEILVDDEVISTATSDADYGIAQCSGSVGE